VQETRVTEPTHQRDGAEDVHHVIHIEAITRTLLLANAGQRPIHAVTEPVEHQTDDDQKQSVAVKACHGIEDTRSDLCAQLAPLNSYGLNGSSYDLGKSASTTALVQLEKYVKDGPVIASVHYKFDPKSTIPHLVVIDGIASSTVYYNDPAAKAGELQISVADFVKGWKKRVIVLRPASGYAAKSNRASTITSA